MTKKSHQEIQLDFEKFAKKVIKNAAIDIYRKENSCKYFEEIKDLSESIPIFDESFFVFNMKEVEVIVKDEFIAELLKELPKEKREILLARFFLDYSDDQIATALDQKRRTINKKRHQIIIELRNKLERKKESEYAE